MKIICISHYCNRPQDGFIQSCNRLSSQWKALGHEVLIVSSSFSHTRKTQPIPGFEMIDNLQYLWLKTPKYKDNGVLRALNMFIFTWQIFKNRKILYKQKPDAIIIATPNIFTVFPARYIAKKTKSKLIYEIRDLWPLTPKELGKMSRFHPFIFTLQMAENYGYKYCDACVSVLSHVHPYVEAHGLDMKKLRIISNGIDQKEMESPKELPIEHAQIIQGIQRNGQFLIGYSGSISQANELVTIIKAVSNPKIKNKVSLVLLGNGPDKDSLNEYVMQNEIENVHFLDSVEKQSVLSFIREMDVLYMGLKKSPIYRYGVSLNKMYEYLYSGKPIIEALGAVGSPIQDIGCGISIPPENENSVVDAIYTLLNYTAEQRVEMGARGRAYVLKNCTYDLLAKKYLEVLNDIST